MHGLLLALLAIAVLWWALRSIGQNTDNAQSPSYAGSPYTYGYGVGSGSNDPRDVVRDVFTGRRYGRV